MVKGPHKLLVFITMYGVRYSSYIVRPMTATQTTGQVGLLKNKRIPGQVS
jgi:hypothetical protein